VCSLTRRQFHGLLAGGAGTILLGSGGCATMSTVTPANGQVSLSFAQFPQLGSAGGSAVVNVTGSFPIAVIRSGATSATALSATCTHASCILDVSSAASQLHCPCHNAAFSLEGAVLAGPTSIPLPVYSAVVNADAIVVTIG
jgi:nitrite reductase/ring-hydroxylating ferredoxin subunit